ncbi:hypothetical protein FIV31_06865 [Coxiella endosymbiont of Ornithodoros amblus]|nr:hypothetical protein [Coxiella endosymbiont of Ornithodoros amblus]
MSNKRRLYLLSKSLDAKTRILGFTLNEFILAISLALFFVLLGKLILAMFLFVMTVVLIKLIIA